MRVFARLAPILHAQSVLSNKISASELSQKFIKSAWLVGKFIERKMCDTGKSTFLFLTLCCVQLCWKKKKESDPLMA